MRCNPLRWLLLALVVVPVITYLAVQNRLEYIQDDLRQRSESALRRNGMSWAGSAFVGRDGLISGRAIEEVERQRAEQVVRNVWGVYHLENGTNLIDKEDNYVWSAKRRPKEIRLNGFVPNEATRRSILGIAEANFPDLRIDDRMRYARGVPSRDVWMGGISFGLKQLARLNSGQVVLSGLDLSVKGDARDFAAYKTLKSALANRMPKGVMLKRDLVAPPRVSPYVWSARYKGRQLVLMGYVPSEKGRDDVFAAAKTFFPKLTIVDRMQTALGQPRKWFMAVKAALGQLARLNSGTVQLTDDKMNFSGVAATEALAGAVDTALRRGLPRDYSSNRNIGFIKPAIKIVSPFVTSATVVADRIEIEGYVPGKKALVALVSAARASFPKRRIVDNTEIAGGAHRFWQKCAVIGMGALGRLGNGSFTMSGRELVVAGSTHDGDLANSLAGEVRAAATRKCDSEVRIDYQAPPEPNLVWTANWNGDSVVLDGEVPDAKTKTDIMRSATSLYPNASIIDRMTVVGGYPRNWSKVALRGLQMLSTLRNGRARIDAQRLVVRGEARDSSSAGAIRTALAQDLPKAYRGRDAIIVRSDAMIWAEKEARRKAEQEAKRKAEQEAAARQAALVARRKAEQEAEEQRRRRRLDAERAAAAQAARQKAQEQAAREREAFLEAERQRALERESRERKARLEAEIRAAVANKPAGALRAAKQEKFRSVCEKAIAKVVRGGIIRFRRARANLSRASYKTLNQVAAASKKCPGLRVQIEGHTDSDGPAARNQKLSERRAAAVRDYLIKAGVVADRLVAVGYGETRPLVPNNSRKNKARNRRIEFKVRAN